MAAVSSIRYTDNMALEAMRRSWRGREGGTVVIVQIREQLRMTSGALQGATQS